MIYYAAPRFLSTGQEYLLRITVQRTAMLLWIVFKHGCVSMCVCVLIGCSYLLVYHVWWSWIDAWFQIYRTGGRTWQLAALADSQSPNILLYCTCQGWNSGELLLWIPRQSCVFPNKEQNSVRSVDDKTVGLEYIWNITHLNHLHINIILSVLFTSIVHHCCSPRVQIEDHNAISLINLMQLLMILSDGQASTEYLTIHKLPQAHHAGRINSVSPRIPPKSAPLVVRKWWAATYATLSMH